MVQVIVDITGTEIVREISVNRLILAVYHPKKVFTELIFKKAGARLYNKKNKQY